MRGNHVEVSEEAQTQCDMIELYGEAAFVRGLAYWLRNTGRSYTGGDKTLRTPVGSIASARETFESFKDRGNRNSSGEMFDDAKRAIIMRARIDKLIGW